jgi:transcriptional regulator with XRE-family HTH domain
MHIREVFAANLRRLRNERGFSQENLADKAEVDRTYVSLLERSKYAVSIDVLAKLADVLDVDPADLLKRLPPAREAKQKEVDLDG